MLEFVNVDKLFHECMEVATEHLRVVLIFLFVDFTVGVSEVAKPSVVGEVVNEGFEEGRDDVEGHQDGLARVAVVAARVGDFDGENWAFNDFVFNLKILPNGDVGSNPNAVGEACFREDFHVKAKAFQKVLDKSHLNFLMCHDIGRSHAESWIGAKVFIVLLFVKRLEVAEFVARVILHSGKKKDL